MSFQFIVFLLVVLSFFLVIVFAVNPIAKKIVSKTPNKWDDFLVEKKVISRALQFIPATVFGACYTEFLKPDNFLLDICSRLSIIWFTLILFAVGSSVLDFLEYLNDFNHKRKVKSFHGTFQAVKLLLFCVSAIIVVSQIIGKSPVFILSALGAMATVMMLVFRDSILGVVSGIQINLSDLFRKGDWIEIERHHADGQVIDITLTSVKIRNWDKTISVIPAYDLITNSFKNWRGMQDSGVRRIKRSLFIDQHSVHFLTKEELERLSEIEILKSYLDRKHTELNAERNNILENETQMDLLNYRHLTNLGTFRAYCNAYLKTRNTIAQNMTLMTRQLAPTPEGLPLEIYAFASVTNWELYENIQSDIFDHLIAALPEFGLRLFQYSGQIGNITNR